MKSPTHPLFRGLGLFLVAALMARSAADYTTSYAFSTLAGISSIGSQDGTGPAARFYSPRNVAADSTGNAFVVDTGNHVIRRITPAGAVTTFAGLAGVAGNADGTGAAARFDSPQDIVADAAGNFYVTDTGNHTIRKITPAGIVTTLAGSAGVSGNIDGLAGAARFNEPLGIAIDSTNNLFVTEGGNGTIRRITPAGSVSTYATGLSIREPYYYAIAVAATGEVYVSLFNFRDYRNYMVVDIGFLTQVLPNGDKKYLLQTTLVSQPPEMVTVPSVITDIIPDGAGNLVLAGFRGLTRFYLVDSSGRTITGSGHVGSTDGSAENAGFSTQFGITAAPAGGFIVADEGNNKVRRVSPSGEVSTLAGIALDQVTFTLDGTGTAARIANPGAMARDASGNLYLAEEGSHCIRKITPTGVVTTLAGAPGVAGSTDGPGADARFNGPSGLAVSPAGELYVADTGNSTIRRITATGVVTTVAGTPPGGASSSVFRFPRGVAINAAGTVFVADTNNSSIRMIAPDGSVQTFVGVTGEGGTVDGTGSAARFTLPQAITASPGGDLYVTESSENPSIARVRRIAPNGTVTTIAGSETGYNDGNGTAARFHDPKAITIDSSGNLFVADSSNQAIRRVTPAGVVSTVAGLVDAPGSSDGTGPNARFYYPRGIVADAEGNLYVSGGTVIRKGSIAPLPTLSVQPVSQTVQAGSNATFSVTANGNAPLAYQWYFNGTVIAGATNSSFNLGNVRSTDAGEYKVTVSNDGGNVTSSPATLTITAAPVTPPPAAGGGSTGGGGAPSEWFLGALAVLACRRKLAGCFRSR